MRRAVLVLAALLATTALTAVPTAHAVTNEQTPCDSRILRAQHAASADYYDFNGDRLECWAHDGTNEAPGDNHRLNTAPSGADSRKFFSWPRPGRPATSVSFVDPLTRTFGGWIEGQEDDPDFDGCREVCLQTLTYDANDYFYFDTGSGSTRVSLAYFETHVRGLVRFTMVYSRIPGESSVFSFEAAPPRPAPHPQVSKPTRPRHVTARARNHRALVRWVVPLRGRPIDAYQVRRKGRDILIADARRRSVTVRGLVNGRLYAVAVRAHNTAGWGPWSAVAKVRPHR